MWAPSQVHRMAGCHQKFGQQCRLPNVRTATASLRRHAQPLPSPSNLPTKPRSKRQRGFQSQADVSNQASVVLTAPADVQQVSAQQAASTQPRSIVISIDYTADADQAVQWALDYLVKPGEAVHSVRFTHLLQAQDSILYDVSMSYR